MIQTFFDDSRCSWYEQDSDNSTCVLWTATKEVRDPPPC